MPCGTDDETIDGREKGQSDEQREGKSSAWLLECERSCCCVRGDVSPRMVRSCVSLTDAETWCQRSCQELRQYIPKDTSQFARCQVSWRRGPFRPCGGRCSSGAAGGGAPTRGTAGTDQRTASPGERKRVRWGCSRRVFATERTGGGCAVRRKVEIPGFLFGAI